MGFEPTTFRFRVCWLNGLPNKWEQYMSEVFYVRTADTCDQHKFTWLVCQCVSVSSRTSSGNFSFPTLPNFVHELKNSVAQVEIEPIAFGFLFYCSTNWATEPLGEVYNWIPLQPQSRHLWSSHNSVNSSDKLRYETDFNVLFQLEAFSGNS